MAPPYLNHFNFLQTISFIYFLFTLTYTVSSLTHDEECSALFQFKQSIIHQHDEGCGASWFQTFHSWKLTSNASDAGFDCCFWYGVECNNDHVIGLDLSESSLCGHINSTSPLFSLVHLHTLNLAMNDFSESQIPSEIASLKKLKTLNLSGSGFSGQIPNEISQLMQLSSLDLSRNPLKLRSHSGLKNLLQNLTTLEEIDLSSVDISSSVPHFLANFSSLRSIKLFNCSLRNEIPAAILELPQLKYLNMNSNTNLTGSFREFRNYSLIEHVDLAYTCFFGSVPESISNLNHLTFLHISRCSFSGRIPRSLSNLTQLKALGLGSNKFTGFVPLLARLSKLIILELNGNKFENRRLPNWLGKLTKLTDLLAYDMNIHGKIPSFLANLTKLSVVAMGNNSLIGHIPFSFFNLSQLTLLNLQSNQLQGPTLSSFANFISLEDLNLISNNFRGRVDLDLFLQLNNLKSLGLGDNWISLVASNNYTNTTLPELEYLDLESCNLKEFPSFLRFQNKLRTLYLNNNKITGLVPVWIWNIRQETLELINLSNNSIAGFHQHPQFLSWRRLEAFDINHNQVQGELPIPPQTTTMVLNLKKKNNFHGIMMNVFMHVSLLRSIDLSENGFTGQLPRSLTNCTNLEVLSFGDNSFHDVFPSWLETLPKLQVLVLRSNKLYGPIQGSTTVHTQFRKLRIIDLSNNNFSGQLNQKYFRTWNAMHSIPVGVSPVMGSKISSKMVDSSLSYSMTIIHKGVRTEYEKILTIDMAIDLSCNHFEGKIPLSLQDLRGLQSLNLSNNQFRGRVLPWLGNLTNLESLDLSQNKLSGELPQQLVQLSFLAIFNVSFNHLDGHIPQGKQFDTFDSNSYIDNLGLCGKPLSKECQDSEGTRLPPTSNTSESLLPSERIDWIIIFYGVGSGLDVGIVLGNFLHTRYSDLFTKRKDRWVRPLRNTRRN